MFDTLLVANRGEIARRVIRSAKARGLRTVAVYSDADRQAAHVREADTACRIGPTPASESYLDIEAILAAARDSGAQAIHPGYGFLSERAEFARAVTDAGLVFVGPSADVMDQMGRKDRAREIAVAAGVPVVPDHPVDSTDLPEDEFPILVKAAAGGGGKGMRVVRKAADLQEAIDSARREAKSSFGDDTLLIERYVENGRHVEVQVLADTHGHVVHLFERDCSAQRRHQKVIEEAPSPSVTEEVRAVLTDSAVALARTVGYVNAGTVEFLVDPDRGTDGVYFLEMNTRLQVEHPVTELTVGLDLVDLQLAIAAGEPLPFEQDDLTCTGHAMEARVYAEDAFNGFLPQAGTATFVHWSGPGAQRRGPGQRADRRHVVRPDARQGHRARTDPRGRAQEARRRARRHRRDRPDHQHRLPARAGRERRVPRRRHRHRLARPQPGRRTPSRRRRGRSVRGLGRRAGRPARPQPVRCR